MWRSWLCVALRWQHKDSACDRVYLKGHKARNEHVLILNPRSEVYLFISGFFFPSQYLLFAIPNDRKTQAREHFAIFSYLNVNSNVSCNILVLLKIETSATRIHCLYLENFNLHPTVLHPPPPHHRHCGLGLEASLVLGGKSKLKNRTEDYFSIR